MSAAALTGLIGNLAQQQAQLPLSYGGLYQNAYAPGFNYLQNQANNMTSIGQAGMGLYGNLAGQQASMYQAELPHQMEMAMFNSLAPALGNLLGQGGFGGMSISPINMQFNRPDVMSGYQGAVDRAYTEAKGYDGTFGAMQADMMDKMPTAPYMQPQQPAPMPSGRPLPPPVPLASYPMSQRQPRPPKQPQYVQPRAAGAQRQASPGEMAAYNRSMAVRQQQMNPVAQPNFYQ